MMLGALVTASAVCGVLLGVGLGRVACPYPAGDMYDPAAWWVKRGGDT